MWTGGLLWHMGNVAGKIKSAQALLCPSIKDLCLELYGLSLLLLHAVKKPDSKLTHIFPRKSRGFIPLWNVVKWKERKQRENKSSVLACWKLGSSDPSWQPVGDERDLPGVGGGLGYIAGNVTMSLPPWTGSDIIMLHHCGGALVFGKKLCGKTSFHHRVFNQIPEPLQCHHPDDVTSGPRQRWRHHVTTNKTWMSHPFLESPPTVHLISEGR